jgi:molybdopterin-guanine dinucleotide biosynthesis protein
VGKTTLCKSLMANLGMQDATFKAIDTENFENFICGI